MNFSQEERAEAVKKLMAIMDEMAACVDLDCTPEQMDEALEEALAAVRPVRLWAK